MERAVEIIREILAAHESGISRDGLLAWARLRGDPTMTDAQLDAALASLGDQVVDVDGFLYLREHAPASASSDMPAASSDAPVPGAWPPPAADAGGWTASESPGAWPPPAADAGGWTAPDGSWAAPSGGWVPAPAPGSRRTMLVAAGAVAAFVVVAGLVTVMLRDDGAGGVPAATSAPATAALPTPTAGSVVDANSLAVGDCLILPSEDQFDEVRRLACSDPHDGEVFFAAAHPGPDYPSDEVFRSYVNAQCLPAFAAYTGSDFNGQDALDVGWFAPTEGSWGGGDRMVTCYLTPADGSRTSQSFRGANP